MAGPVELDLARLIAEDERLDIATLSVSAREVGILEDDDLQVVRPPEWPLPIPAVHDPVVLAGYPGEWRADLSWHELDLGAETMRAFVRSVTEEQFTTHLDLEYQVQHQIDVSEGPRPFAFAGLSGGPTFLEPASPNVLAIARLCGTPATPHTVHDAYAPSVADLLIALIA